MNYIKTRGHYRRKPLFHYTGPALLGLALALTMVQAEVLKFKVDRTFSNLRPSKDKHPPAMTESAIRKTSSACALLCNQLTNCSSFFYNDEGNAAANIANSTRLRRGSDPGRCTLYKYPFVKTRGLLTDVGTLYFRIKDDPCDVKENCFNKLRKSQLCIALYVNMNLDMDASYSTCADYGYDMVSLSTRGKNEDVVEFLDFNLDFETIATGKPLLYLGARLEENKRIAEDPFWEWTREGQMLPHEGSTGEYQSFWKDGHYDKFKTLGMENTCLALAIDPHTKKPLWLSVECSQNLPHLICQD